MNNEELDSVARDLGLVETDFLCVKCAANRIEAVENLKLLRGKARKGLRQAAKFLHPDINGGDEDKTARFKKLVEFVGSLDKLKIVERPPVQPVTFVIRGFGSPLTSYTSTSSTSTGVWNLNVRFVG